MSNQLLHGYNGKVLRVALSDRKIITEEPPLDFYQRYLGGRGFIAYTLLKEMKAGEDPYGPENRLIFALGPITGMPLAGSGRNSVGAKSPLTGAFGEAEAGGFWGAELKRSGFDAIIVEGVADAPVYLWIENGKAELRDGTDLWGMEVAQTQSAIREELGLNKIRTAVIGPAGERQIRFASIFNDITHVAGRTGLGAVMGSKRLKAIAVKGDKTPPMANKTFIQELSRWMALNFKEKAGVWKYGTGHLVEAYSLAGNLPTLNFREGSFEDAAKISARTICEQFRVEMYGCYACPLRCKKRVKVEEPYTVDPIYGGPEYETIAAFGSNCGIADAKAICKAHEICNRYGIDTISAGVTLAFAMECYENGLLTNKDTDGLELRFGNVQAMLEMLQKIVRKEGLGELLSEGSRLAAKQIGGEAEKLAMHVKGYEMAMHDPRLKQGLGLNCAVNPAGADHASSIHDTTLLKGPLFEDWASIDVNESIPSTELSPRKARLVYQFGLWLHLTNYLGVCTLVPYSRKQVCDAVEAITGWPMSYWRLMKTAERGMTLAKIFNLREGFSETDDQLPNRMSTPQTKGSLKGVVVDPAAFSEAKQFYYQMLGWDERGIPTRARLVELGIDWATSCLDSQNRK
jgi:aldehyde:ferredoxin oxidoreductase